jgi:P27 family predicted phage terminase small subunit
MNRGGYIPRGSSETDDHAGTSMRTASKNQEGGITMKRLDGAKLVTVTGGAGVPPEPDWSRLYARVVEAASAHEQWGLVTRELAGAQTLSTENGNMIRRLVQFRVEFERASDDVAKRGTMLKAQRTGVPQVNPFWPIMRQASEAIRILEIELGLPPVRRAKAGKVNNAAKKSRPSDAYLKPVRAD